MTKINKKMILPSFVVTAFLIAALYGGSQVLAENVTKYPPIVQKIANKFGLNEADVNEVFEQEKAEFWQRKKQMFGDQLEQAVKDGKITEDQKNKILEKRDEIQSNREAERITNKEEWQQWLKDNGIDPNNLMPYFKFGGFGGKTFHHMHMMN